MSYLVLVCHGELQWNRKYIFTGWADVSITGQEIEGV